MVIYNYTEIYRFSFPPNLSRFWKLLLPRPLAIWVFDWRTRRSISAEKRIIAPAWNDSNSAIKLHRRISASGWCFIVAPVYWPKRESSESSCDFHFRVYVKWPNNDDVYLSIYTVFSTNCCFVFLLCLHCDDLYTRMVEPKGGYIICLTPILKARPRNHHIRRDNRRW